MTRTKPLIVALMIVLIIVLSACNGNAPTDAPAEAPTETPPQLTDTTPFDTPVIDRNSYQEHSYVESMQINIMESFPLQVSVTIQGNLPDGCTELVDLKATKMDETTFEVHIYTMRDPQAICTMALVPFEETLPLDVAGLPAGTYSVRVYDLLDTFTFDQNN